MKAFETIELSLDGNYAQIRLNRPERLNAMTPTMLRELAEAAARIDGARDVSVVRIDGRGRAFCAGADLTDLAVMAAPLDADALREVARLGTGMVDAIAGMRAVTVASVRGCAVGAGLLLAAVCDLRVVEEAAILSIPEVQMGLPLTWGGVPRLVRELGPALARELIMTGRPFTPAEALAAGFVNRVVPADALEAETAALVGALLQGPALPLRMTKAQVNASLDALLPVEASEDAELMLAAMSDPGFLDTAVRYLQKRRLGE